MPPSRLTEHRTFANTSLPYISNSSITSTNPQFIGGSQNLLTGQREWVERRPGFSQSFETNPTTFTKLVRQFLWRRWAGSFFWMGCDIAGGVATVYKIEIGVDPQALPIWTSTSAEPFDFVVSNNLCFFGNGTDMKKFDGTTVWNWGIVAPVAGPGLTLVTGTANIFTSWCYCYTYANDGVTLFHESSPSPISACSGVFASKAVRLSVVASADPQVTRIRVYRTTDGGAQTPDQMQEISGSPFPNATATLPADSTPDTSLSIRVGPPFNRNDPPTPSKGFVTYGGRIWGFNKNVTYYSAFEETADPVPEECWPSGLDGNSYPWAYEVTAHAPLLDGIAVYQPLRISKVEGDSLDTFRRYTLLERRGTRQRAAVAAMGGSVAWFDTAGQVWVSEIGEIGLPIRPDTQNMDQTQVQLAVHISGIYHWVVLLDGATGRVFVYDLDKNQWMPPWTVGTTASGLVSGETSLGVVNLLLARNNTKSVELVSGSYVDDTTPFTPVLSTNMYRLTPEGNPSWKGVHDWTEIKTDTSKPVKVEQLTDDDPALGTYTDITGNGEPTPDITQGQFLQSWRYPSNNPTAQFMGVRYTWEAENKNFHLYQIDEAFHQFGE